MRVIAVMAQLIVSDLATSVRFYGSVFGREPDARPMYGLAEWHFAGAGAIQVFEEAARAGKSGVTVGVDNVDQQIAALEAAGIDHDPPIAATYVRLTTLSDPDGNRIVFTEPLPA